MAAADRKSGRGALRPHRTPEGEFFNPWLVEEDSAWRLLRWWLSRRESPGDPARFPHAPAVANDGAYLGDPAAPASLTWLGHAAFVFQGNGQCLVVDPFFGPRALLARRLVPAHWGVLRMGDEPPGYPAELLRRAAAKDPALARALAVLPVGGRLLLEGAGG